MLSALSNLFKSRAGRAQAEREIDLVGRGIYTPDEMNEAIKDRLSGYGYRDEYQRAYARRWYEEGWSDAIEGKLRSAQFQRSDYDAGWVERMKEIREHGFRHSTHEAAYIELVKRYVDEDGWAYWGLGSSQR